MLIVGLNTTYHESAVAVIRDGVLMAAIEEERLNRVKHGKLATIDNTVQLPFAALDRALELVDATIDDVDVFAFSFDHDVRHTRTVSHEHPYEIRPGDYGSALGEARFRELGLLAPRLLSLRAGRPLAPKCRFFRHHACHAASAFDPSPFDEAAVLCVDGIGEFESTTCWRASDDVLERKGRVDYPHSLGFLWERITGFLGLRPGHDECKVMGLAAYGDPMTFDRVFSRFVARGESGQFRVNDAVLRFRAPRWDPLECLLGPRRLAHEPLDPLRDGDSRRFADIAAALQRVTEQVIFDQVRQLKLETSARNLCMAGGVALNCVTNGKIARAGLFDDVWIQPAAHDAGTAVGAAALAWREFGDGTRLRCPSPVFLGPGFADVELDAAIEEFRVPAARIGRDGPDELAARLAAGQVIARFDGRMEFGPRALGNRSILADPRRPDSRARVNAMIKRRELFRPLCPSVLAERVHDWFDIGARTPLAARYMLTACPVLDSKRARVPAVVHVDGSARLQAVQRDEAPGFHALLEAFEARTGVPMLLNTSFNSREPIVCTPADALRTFLRTGLDALVLGDRVVTRPAAPLRRHAAPRRPVYSTMSSAALQ